MITLCNEDFRVFTFRKDSRQANDRFNDANEVGGEVMAIGAYFSKVLQKPCVVWKWGSDGFNPQYGFLKKNSKRKAFLRASASRVQIVFATR